MIEGYEGRPGAGKTLTMVSRAFRLKERGRSVYSNIPLVDYRTTQRRRHFFFGEKYTTACNAETYGKPWTDGPVLQSLDETLSLDNALILLDEVHMWVGSDQWKEVPFEVRQMLAQQRKDGLDIWWTAQSNARVFNVIRELTATLWSCQRFGPMIVLLGRDPMTKESYGKRFVPVAANHYQLYNSWFKVGDGKGSEGTVGKSERLNLAVPDPNGLDLVEKRKPPVHAYMRRVQEQGGYVRYEHSHEARSWWFDKLSGKDPGPHPFLGGAELG